MKRNLFKTIFVFIGLLSFISIQAFAKTGRYLASDVSKLDEGQLLAEISNKREALDAAEESLNKAEKTSSGYKVAGIATIFSAAAATASFIASVHLNKAAMKNNKINTAFLPEQYVKLQTAKESGKMTNKQKAQYYKAEQNGWFHEKYGTAAKSGATKTMVARIASLSFFTTFLASGIVMYLSKPDHETVEMSEADKEKLSTSISAMKMQLASLEAAFAG